MGETHRLFGSTLEEGRGSVAPALGGCYPESFPDPQSQAGGRKHTQRWLCERTSREVAGFEMESGLLKCIGLCRWPRETGICFKTNSPVCLQPLVISV